MDRITFFRSFHESLQDCTPEIRLEIYDAICAFCFEDREPDFSIQMSNAIWKLIRPILENSKRQSVNGRRGGAKIGNKNACRSMDSEEENKPQTTQKQPTNKPKTSRRKANMDNSSANTAAKEVTPIDENFIKFNEWIKANAPYCANPSNLKQLTQEEFLKLKARYSSIQIRDTILNLENRRDKRKTYSNLYRTLQNWLKNDYGE